MGKDKIVLLLYNISGCLCLENCGADANLGQNLDVRYVKYIH